MAGTGWTRADTDWFRAARWGVFFHYLADIHLPADVLADADGPARWNGLVDGFDAESLAAQLREIGARYFFLTIGQNSGYFCSPNGTYDRIVGRQPSRLSRRDLVADLAGALEPAGVRMMVYLPSLAPCRDRQAIRALRCTPPWDAGRVGFPPESCFPEEGKKTDERMTEFQRNWEAVIREWSLRWGRKVHGWWIDGCYAADTMYRSPEPPNFRSFAEAMKAGNPDSVVAFNPGVRNPVVSHTEFDDYTAGEISNTLPTDGDEPCVIPVGRRVAGAQYHILSFLGGSWGSGKPRFSDAMAAAYTRYVNSWGGAVTWDVPALPGGTIPEPFMAQLRRISAEPVPAPRRDA